MRKGWNSRRCSRPSTLSTSALVSITAAIGVLRVCSVGKNSGSCEICCRRSGEAFNRSQLPGSGEMATSACVRFWPFNTPTRRRLQFEHPQFHCGKPPPAAEPRAFTRIYRLQFGVRVRADFAAQANLFVLGCGPFHGCGLRIENNNALRQQPMYAQKVYLTSCSQGKRTFNLGWKLALIRTQSGYDTRLCASGNRDLKLRIWSWAC